MLNVFYMSYQPYFLEIAKILYEKDGFYPVYWNVIDSIEDKIKESFPNCILHNHFDALKGNPVKTFQNIELEPICPNILIQLNECEKITLRMMERNDTYSNNFSFQDRILLYKYFVQYWITIIKKLEPKYIFFEEEPHQASEYVLYKVAKLLNINTIMFIRTTINQRMYAVNEFEIGSNIIKRDYQKLLNDKKQITLSKEIEEYLSKVRGEYKETISLHLYDQTENVNELISKNFNFLKKIKSFFNKIMYLKNFLKYIELLFNFNSNEFKSDQKQFFKTFQNSKLTYIEHIYYKSKSIIKKYFLKKYYIKVSEKNIDLTIPYVFCAIHYQPEKTTCPLGGIFDNQLYMIELISKTIPKGWYLYVKEHPSQFVTSYARYGEHFRSYEYYNKIRELKNVKLISIKTDTFSLIDNAKAVATVTGTSAWESIIRGIPSITFGHSWFNHCNGVTYIESLEDLISFFEKIQKNNFQIKLDDIKYFLKVIENNTFKGIVGGDGIQKYFNITIKENAKEHVKAIKALISSTEEGLSD